MIRRSSILLMLLMLTMSVTAGKHSYQEHSILSSGRWVKIAVNHNGIHRLSYDQIRKAGLNPNEIRIYGYGGTMLAQGFSKPKIDDLPAVPFVRKGDQILFYAVGPIGWSYNGAIFTHSVNPYSLQGYYFLTDNTGEANIPVDVPELEIEGNITDITTYTELSVHDIDKVNLLDVKAGQAGGGRVFYGEEITSFNPTLKIDMPLTHTPVAGSAMIVHMEAAAQSKQQSKFTLKMNGVESYCYTAAIDNLYTQATTGMIYGEFPSSSSASQQAIISFQNSDNASSGYLDYVELNALVPLKMTGSQMAFRTTEGYQDMFGTTLRYKISNTQAGTLIWDVTNRDSIRQIPTTRIGDTLVFLGSNANAIHEYIAFNPNGSGWYEATISGSVSNQDLHKLKDIDFVIISPERFLSAARSLADTHERIDGITTAVVTDQQVYNEFSSGTPDATAYRWIMKMLRDRSQQGIGQEPKHLLLLGTGTFDNRKILSTSGNNVLLTYQARNSTVETSAYVTDDYFGFLDDNEGDSDISGRMDIGVGRLPAANLEEATNMVNKTIAYMENESYGKWRNRIIVLADDGDHGLHTRVAEAGAELVRVKNPDYVVTKIYDDAYTQETTASGDSYPLARTRLHNLLRQGALFFNYSGHAGPLSITDERMLDAEDIKAMTNKNLAFWMFATCSFSHFDRGSDSRSAGEYAILNPHGGAIGVLSSTRTVFASQNEIINRYLCDTLFAHSSPFDYPMTLGQATRLSKNKTGNDPNKLPYVLFADPALKLKYPQSVHVETESVRDTLHALDTDTLKGYIIDDQLDTATWFNGTVEITIYDKLQQLKTRDNDEKQESKKVIETFNDYPNVLFNGEVSVTEGRFSMPLRLPKDIHYNYGNGRIVYYAYDRQNAADGIGHYHDFVIGGSSSSWVVDSVGPTIRMWLNNPRFTSGDETFEDPHFYASIYDENGINTAGAGIGHDLLLVVDNDIKQTYVMNDYFTADNGSYTSGEVSFKFTAMPEGGHRLFFRAWDLLNNSSSATLNFQVVKDLSPTIYSLTTYPNPVRSSEILYMHIDYDREESICQITLRVYDTAGRMVFQRTQTDDADIEWNLGQMAVAGGIYIYQFEIQTTTSKPTIKQGKLIILN